MATVSVRSILRGKLSDDLRQLLSGVCARRTTQTLIFASDALELNRGAYVPVSVLHDGSTARAGTEPIVKFDAQFAGAHAPAPSIFLAAR